MTLTTVGFPSPPAVDAVQDAQRSRHQGVQFPVVEGGGFTVTINASADRTVNISPGVAWAHGVSVNSDAVESLQLDPVSTSGQTRWDAIVLRRNWTSSLAFLVKVPGVAALNAPMVAPALNNSIGVLHDQLLALAQVTSGQTNVTAIDNRRFQASKVFACPSVAALPAASASPWGSEMVLPDGTRYRRLLDDSNNPAWLNQNGSFTELTGAAVLTPASGWSTNNPMVTRCLKGPHSRQLDLQFNRTGGTLNSDAATGDAPNTTVAQLTAACRPDYDLSVPISYISGSQVNLGGTCVLTAGGTLTYYASSNPGMDLTKASSASEVSLRVSLNFNTRGL